MSKLLVYFTGLCGLAAEKPLTPQPDNRVRVSLVNGDHMKPKHIATIVIKGSFVDLGQTDRTYKEVRPDPQNPARVFYRFDIQTKERITFHPTAHLDTDTGALAVVNGLVEGNPECPTPDDYRDIYWLLHMSRLGNFDGRMRRDCMFEHHKVSNLVKCQLVLDEGLLENADFSRDNHGNVLIWDGIRPNGTVARRQALGDLILLTKEVDGTPYVQFERREKIGNGEQEEWVPKEKITLQGEDPVVEVKNVPSDVICGERLAVSGSYSDPHFHHMFHLMRQPADAKTWEAEDICDPGLSIASVGDLCRPLEVRFNDPQCPGGWFA